MENLLTVWGGLCCME